MAAYDALGQGGGTIYITGSSTSGAWCTSTAGQGDLDHGFSRPKLRQISSRRLEKDETPEGRSISSV